MQGQVRHARNRVGANASVFSTLDIVLSASWSRSPAGTVQSFGRGGRRLHFSSLLAKPLPVLMVMELGKKSKNSWFFLAWASRCVSCEVRVLGREILYATE